MQLLIARRIAGVAGLSAAAAALSLAGAVPAFADGAAPGGCAEVGIQHSVDGGAHWSTSGRMDGPDVPTRVEVRLTGQVEPGCAYPVSLASYSAQGPTWRTSGTQAFLGWDTTVLDSTKTEATLDVSAYAPSCFGQIDLYGNSHEYDGVHGALPHYPDSPTPWNLITAWNGSAPCTTQSPTPAPSTTGTPTPVPSRSGTPTATPTAKPTAKPTATPTVPAKPSPSTSAGSTTPPVGQPKVPPTSPTPTGTLAHTGSDSAQTELLASSGAALVLLGAGAVYATRRRNRAGAR